MRRGAHLLACACAVILVLPKTTPIASSSTANPVIPIQTVCKHRLKLHLHAAASLPSLDASSQTPIERTAWTAGGADLLRRRPRTSWRSSSWLPRSALLQLSCDVCVTCALHCHTHRKQLYLFISCNAWPAQQLYNAAQSCLPHAADCAQVNSRRAAAAEADVERLQRLLTDAEKRAESLAWQVTEASGNSTQAFEAAHALRTATKRPSYAHTSGCVAALSRWSRLAAVQVKMVSGPQQIGGDKPPEGRPAGAASYLDMFGCGANFRR